ncbi:4Fe-4S binding protein [Candidatus Micrarchaeota archaeon]|nr:4Fe-4S binding protein [Candidatus Micrarchaeota archaeon]
MKCGLCISKCESNALFQNKNKTPKLFDKLCTGCKTCIYSCPYNAIKEKSKLIGWTYFGKNLGISIYSGELKPSEPLSEKIVDAVKKRGLGKKGITIIDTAAGAHCNVVKALEGCDFAFLITEPTLLGEHDLKAIKKVAKLLGIKYTVVLNRADITGKTISASMKIPYSRKLLECYVDGVSIVEKYPKHEISQKFLEIATGLLK